MEILSVNPMWLVYEDKETFFKTTIKELPDNYFNIEFIDHWDDALEPTQTITIHRNDLDRFVEILNRATNLL